MRCAAAVVSIAMVGLVIPSRNAGGESAGACGDSATRGVWAKEAPADELWRIIDECCGRMGRPWPEDENVALWTTCGRALEGVAASTAPGDEARLWQFYDALPEESGLRDHVLDGILQARLGGLGQDLPESERPPARARDDTPAPRHLAAASAELKDAWRAYESLRRAYADTRTAVNTEDEVSVQDHWPQFRAIVADFLRDRVSGEDTIDAVSRFVWGGWCGTGSESLARPRARTIALALLGARHDSVAAGAALAAGLSAAFREGEGDTAWLRRILTAAGEDWETVYVGATLAGSSMASELGKHGSARGARLLLGALDLPPDEYRLQDRLGDQAEVLHGLAAFVESDGECSGYGTSSSLDMVRASHDPIPADVQQAVLDVLAQKIQPESGAQEAEVASHLLLRLCRPESRTAFADMVRSPLERVRERGAIGLRGLGFETPDPERARPVAFRILVDGRPAAGARVETEVHLEGGMTSSTWVAADAQGIVRLERDLFSDPRHPATGVRLSADRQAGGGDATWFSVTPRIPSSLDRVTTVAVTTQSLALLAPGLPEGARVELKAKMRRYGLSPMFWTVGEAVPVPASGLVRFQSLQKGTYQLVLTWPDGNMWTSSEVVLAGNPVVVRHSEAH